MSSGYNIRYLSAAEQDLYDIFDYIRQDSPQAASSLLEKIDNSIFLLAKNPQLGIVPKDSHLRDMGYRVLIVEKYLVFYIVKGKKIQIRRVIHGAQKYNFLL